MAFRDGVSAWWWNGTAGLASLVLAFWVGPRIWRLAKAHGFYTAGDFLESALVHGNHYGTSQRWIREQRAAGGDILLEIDWQGAQQIARAMPERRSIFILPPSRTALETRLRGRKTDSDEVIAGRLRESMADLSHWSEFDYVVVNDEFELALDGPLPGIKDAAPGRVGPPGDAHPDACHR